METKSNFKIVILEDDNFYNKMLTRFLKMHLERLGLLKGFTVDIKSYTSYVDCKRNLPADLDILFTDYYLGEGFTAPMLIEQLGKKRIDCKVVVVSRLRSEEIAMYNVANDVTECIYKNKDSLRNCLNISEAIILDKLSVWN